MIAIQGKVKFAPQVAHALGMAPQRFKSGILGSLLSERDAFVGSKNKTGAFTRKILSKKNIRGGTWSKSVARIFGGRVDDPGGRAIDGMRLVMGVGESGRTRYQKNPRYGVGIYSGVPFRDVIDFLSTGGTIFPHNHRYMIMPIYRNLENKKKTASQWEFYKSNNLLEYVKEGDRIYYFLKNGKGDERDLLFIGIPIATIKKQYNFEGDWNSRLPKVFDRIQKRVDATTNRINNSGPTYG
jgi:hypothetical protein